MAEEQKREIGEGGPEMGDFYITLPKIAQANIVIGYTGVNNQLQTLKLAALVDAQHRKHLKAKSIFVAKTFKY